MIAVSIPWPAAAASRRTEWPAGRTAPVRPSSPKAARPGGDRTPRWALVTARAIARSAAGSSARAPPATLTKTSASPSRRPPWRESTAMIWARRVRSTPTATRRGGTTSVGPTSACTSTSSARLPSIAGKTHEPPAPRPRPGRGGWGRRPARARGRPSRRRRSRWSEPKRFLVARRTRWARRSSPSKDRTQSTRCSRVRGPARPPSLVTWPTSRIVTPRSLATRISSTVTARTWLGAPGAPSTASECSVCTESTAQTCGLERLDSREHRLEAGLREHPDGPAVARAGARRGRAPGPATPRR